MHLYYNDVIMSAMASQITNITIVYSTVYSGANQRKHQSSTSLAFVMGNSPVTGEFAAQRASNADNVSIWWCHHGKLVPTSPKLQTLLLSLVGDQCLHSTPHCCTRPRRHRGAVWIEIRHLTSTVRSRYIAVIFFSYNSRKTPDSSPVRVSFVSVVRECQSDRSYIIVILLCCVHYCIIYSRDISRL